MPAKLKFIRNNKRPIWNVYDGDVIRLNKGETLHVNAMRIGYKPALIDYVDGKVMVQEKKVR